MLSTTVVITRRSTVGTASVWARARPSVRRPTPPTANTPLATAPSLRKCRRSIGHPLCGAWSLHHLQSGGHELAVHHLCGVVHHVSADRQRDRRQARGDRRRGAAGRHRHLPRLVHRRRRADGGVGLRGRPARHLAWLRLQCADGAGHLDRRGAAGGGLLEGPGRLHGDPRPDAANRARLVPGLPGGRVRQRLRHGQGEDPDGRPLALDPHDRLDDRRRGARLRRLHHARLRGRPPPGDAGGAHRGAVVGEGRLRGGGHAPDLRGGGLVEIERAGGYVRLPDRLQPDPDVAVWRRLYWPGWGLVTALTAIVAGFMVGHALRLGQFLSWMVASGRGRMLSQTYPVFALTEGRGGRSVFYALCGLQAVAGLAFLALALVGRRRRLAAAVAGLAGPLWQGTHFGSGFARVEQAVLRSVTEVAPEAAERLVAWSVPLHVFHAATLVVALGALLSIPLRELGRTAQRTEGE